MSKPDLVIIGAGLFGLTIAEHAARELDKKVLIIERRSHIGGNVWDEVDPETGISRHVFGAHLWHNSNERVQNYVEKFTKFIPYEHRVFARSDEQVYPLPMNLGLLSQVFGRYLTPDEARALVLEESAGYSIETAANLKEKAIALIGTTLAEKFILGYTEKQWQTDAEKLPADIITRLPVRYNFDNRYFNDTYQGIPAEGYSTWVTRMAENPNITILLNDDWKNHRDTYVGKVPVIYTGPLDEYFDYSEGRLPWRTVDLVDEVVETSDYQGCAVMNYNDRDVPFTRIHEWRNFTHQAAGELPADKSLITREYSRFAEPGDEPYYPVNSSDSVTLAKHYKDRAAAEEDNQVFFGGRLGNFAYYDMHQAISSALHTWEKKIKPVLS